MWFLRTRANYFHSQMQNTLACSKRRQRLMKPISLHLCFSVIPFSFLSRFAGLRSAFDIEERGINWMLTRITPGSVRYYSLSLWPPNDDQRSSTHMVHSPPSWTGAYNRVKTDLLQPRDSDNCFSDYDGLDSKVWYPEMRFNPHSQHVCTGDNYLVPVGKYSLQIFSS